MGSRFTTSSRRLGGGGGRERAQECTDRQKGRARARARARCGLVGEMVEDGLVAESYFVQELHLGGELCGGRDDRALSHRGAEHKPAVIAREQRPAAPSPTQPIGDIGS